MSQPALERLSRAEDGRIAYRMKRPLPDGTTHLLFPGLQGAEEAEDAASGLGPASGRSGLRPRRAPGEVEAAATTCREGTQLCTRCDGTGTYCAIRWYLCADPIAAPSAEL